MFRLSHYYYLMKNFMSGGYIIMKRLLLCIMLLLFPFTLSYASELIVIQEQGSFMIGGKTVTNEGEFIFADWMNQSGQTAYGDHAYVWYQFPVKAKKLPMIFLHGGGQSKKTWETTPDGREGFQNIFLRRGFKTYLVDQPRRGEAGFSTVSSDGVIPPAYYDRTMFTLFRLGRWPEFYQDTQFPKDKESLNQFMRQGTPNTGPLDFNVVADSIAALLEKTGPAILITHSQGGGAGWFTALRSENIRGIAA